MVEGVQSKYNLLVITEDPHVTHEGRVYTTNSVTNYFLRLVSVYKNICLTAPAKSFDPDESRFIHRLKIISGIKFVGRKYFESKNDALFSPLIYILNIIKLTKLISNAELIFYRLPSPFLPFVFLLSFFVKRPFVLYIAGDFFGRNSKVSGFRASILKPIIFIYNWFEIRAAQRFYTVATGADLANKYKCDIYFTNALPTGLEQDEDLDAWADSKSNEYNILFVGRLDTNKGLDVLGKSLANIRNKVKLSVRIVGNGPDSENIKLHFDELGLMDIVSFTGSMTYGEDLFSEFRNADLFVLPSRSEGIPKVLIEAMYFGVPVVASNVGGIPYILGDAGILVEPGDVDELQSAIYRVSNERKLRDSMIGKGRLKSKEYSSDKRLKLLLEHLNNASYEFKSKN